MSPYWTPDLPKRVGHPYKIVGGVDMKFAPLRIYGTGIYSDEYVSFEAEADDLLHNYETEEWRYG